MLSRSPCLTESSARLPLPLSDASSLTGDPSPFITPCLSILLSLSLFSKIDSGYIFKQKFVCKYHLFFIWSPTVGVFVRDHGLVLTCIQFNLIYIATNHNTQSPQGTCMTISELFCKLDIQYVVNCSSLLHSASDKSPSPQKNHKRDIM